MGFIRLLKKSMFGGGNLIQGHINDAIVKKYKTGKSFRECLRESIDETIQEDMPGTSHLYRKGKLDGKVEGTAEQARRDEKKFKDLHNTHQKDRAEWKKQKKDYEDLLDDLENQ